MAPCFLLRVFLCAILLQSNSTLELQFERIAQKARGRVGAAVLLLETGDRAGIRVKEKFSMQSVFKLPIAMAVLHKIDGGNLSLDQKVHVNKSDMTSQGAIRDQHPEGNFDISVRELLRAMMVVSDGTASEVLLKLAGGPTAVTEYLRSVGVNEMVLAASLKEMAGSRQLQDENWATPLGSLDLLRILYSGQSLLRAQRDLLLQLMAESTTGPRRIKGLLPPGTVVSHKTGSSGTLKGLTAATNDVGIITLPNGRHLAVAVFVCDSRAGESARDRVIAEIARAAWDHYSGN